MRWIARPWQTIEVERCQWDGCTVETLPGAAFGAAVTYQRAVPEGEISVRARHLDEAGNVSAWSPTSVARRDRSVPEVAIETPPSPVAPGERLDPGVSTQDAYSGVAGVEREYRVNGGPWQAMNGAVEAPAGATLRFRGRATDGAGNVSGWIESGGVTVRSCGDEPRRDGHADRRAGCARRRRPQCPS